MICAKQHEKMRLKTLFILDNLQLMNVNKFYNTNNVNNNIKNSSKKIFTKKIMQIFTF